MSIIPRSVPGDEWDDTSPERDKTHQLSSLRVQEYTMAMVLLTEDFHNGSDHRLELLIGDRVYHVWGIGFPFLPDGTVEALEKDVGKKY